MSDDLHGLAGYLSEFSGLGAMPTSLGGYGLSRERYASELGAMGAVMQPSTGLPSQPAGAGTVNASKVSTLVLQNYLNSLQVWVKKTGSFDADTKAAWNKYANVFREPHANISAVKTSDGLTDNKSVNISAQALKRLSDKAAASGRLNTEAARQLGSTPDALKKSGPAAAPTQAPASGKEYVTSTAAVQDILIRLGWRDKNKTSGAVSKNLTDGLYGSTVVTNWHQSAVKRKLDPVISKATADGKQVKVNETTYYQLKAVADSLAPPEKRPLVGSSLLSLGPSGASVVDVNRLGEVLGRLSGVTQSAAVDLQSIYAKVTADRKLDSRIEDYDGKKVTVFKPTWDALLREYDAKAPPPPPSTPSEKQNVEAAKGQILKQSTTSTKTSLLRDAFNIAIKQGVLKREAFSSATWTPDFVPPLLTMIKPADAVWQKAWEQLFVPGKLVAKDKKSVLLLSDVSAALKKLVADYQTAKAADTESFAGYTEVNTAKLIEAVNKTFVSSKDFNPSGGAKELADAVKTFLDNTKQTVTGDLVKVNAAKKVFLKTELIAKLDAAVKGEQERAKATEGYRKNMVSEAVKAAAADVTVDQLQQAFAESVNSGKATGDLKKLYSAVKLNGAFDSATRAAYTELARTPMIGLSVQQFQQLLVAQLGPRFKSGAVGEVQNKVWAEVLDKTVAKKDGKQHVKTLPSIAQSVVAASDAYRARKSDAKIANEKLAEQKKMLAEAVKKSTVLLSLFDVQQGLSYAVQKKEVDAQPGLKVSGTADGPTRQGLFELSGMIFPKGTHIPDLTWAQYLEAVGVKVAATKVTRGWNGANYIALPQAAANYLGGRAEKWMADHGLPLGYNDLAPVPLHNEELRLFFDKPTVITVKRPQKVKEVKFDEGEEKALAAKKKKAADKKAAEAKRKAADEKRKLADAKKKKAEEDRRLAEAKKKKAADAAAKAKANAADQKAQQEAAAAEQEAKVADAVAAKSETEAVAARAADLVASREAQQAEIATGGSTSAGGQAGGGASQGGSVGPITINTGGSGGGESGGGSTAPSTEPAAPTEPTAPVAPAEAGMGGGFMWMAAAGIGYMIFGGDKKGEQPRNLGKKKQDRRPQRRYPTRRTQRRKP